MNKKIDKIYKTYTNNKYVICLFVYKIKNFRSHHLFFFILQNSKTTSLEKKEEEEEENKQ